MGFSMKIARQSLVYAGKSLFITIPACRFKILPLSLLYQLVERNIINDLHKFDLLHTLSFKKHDVKKIFYHYILLSVCDAIIRSDDMLKVVISYDEVDMNDAEVVKFTTKFQFTSFMLTVVRKIRNLLPILIYSDSIMLIKQKLSSKGEKIELIRTITDYIDGLNNHKFTFSKTRNFIKNYKLTYLDHELFDKLKSKNLLI